MLLYVRERVPGPQTCFSVSSDLYCKVWLVELKLTLFKSIGSTPKRQLISTNDTSKDRKKTARNPPPNRVTQEIDLLASVVLGPEANSPQQERPLEGLTGVRVTAGQGVVVQEHSPLQLQIFAQE